MPKRATRKPSCSPPAFPPTATTMIPHRLLISFAFWVSFLRSTCCFAYDVEEQVVLATPDSLLDIQNDVLRAFQEAADDQDCSSCHGMLVPLKALARMGDETFTKTITRICIQRKVRRKLSLVAPAWNAEERVGATGNLDRRTRPVSR